MTFGKENIYVEKEKTNNRFFEERMLPVDGIMAQSLAEEVLSNPPDIGYLTISNALQWRLQYSRVIQEAGSVRGIDRIL